MSLELFVARRLQCKKQDGTDVTKPAVRIAIGGIAVGVVVMLLSVAIVIGFKSEVRNKLIGFGAHMQISLASLNDAAVEPMTNSSAMLARLSALPHVKHVQPTANQPGILKTDSSFHAIVMKGVDNTYNWDFFSKNLKDGTLPAITADSLSNQLLISQKTARLLRLSTGNKIRTYYIIDGKARARSFTVCGIYQTGFGDYDEVVVVGDLKHIQRLNGWDKDQCGAYEIIIDDYENLGNALDNVFAVAGNHIDKKTELPYSIRSIKDINPEIFSWLDMLDMNVVIILALMMAVAGFTIISGLLIIVLEHTGTIGLLKALGAPNWSIRKIFLIQSLFMVGKGMAIGNIIGLALCALQYHFGIIGLDPETYYVDTVPIHLSITHWLMINAGVLAASVLMLTGPSYIITKISPAETMRFE